MKNYLPSKKFTRIIIISIVIIALFFIALNVFSKKSVFFSVKDEKLEASKLTVNQLIQKDSDNDGIADWEEALWGTDKNNPATFDGLADATYIENKKKQLNLEQNSMNDENLTETDKLAREFFTAFTAMKASGQVDANTINNFSNALGQKMIDPTLIDVFSEKDIKLTGTDTTIDKNTYYNNVKKLFEKYKASGLGNELDIISSNLVSPSEADQNTPNDNLLKIAQAYKDFSSGVIKISVPASLKNYHLQIANSANNTGVGVFNMSKIINDPVVGISGLSQYQKYSQDLIKAVEELETAL